MERVEARVIRYWHGWISKVKEIGLFVILGYKN